MKAILSDIHGNLEALLAVLGDIARAGVDSIYNLGDITGYGPDPLLCIDVSRDMAIVLQGNFDNAVFTGPEGFSTYPEQSINWTKQLLESSAHDAAAQRRRIEFLKDLPSSHAEGNVVYVHGSPGHVGFAPGYEAYRNEYVFPEDICNRKKMERLGRQFEHVCFNGHTHIPGIHIERGPDDWQFLSSVECGDGFKLDDRKVICNVGSVGQPRDGDWRASYVLFDGTTVTFRRVEYDIEATINKIYAVPEAGRLLGRPPSRRTITP